MIPEQKVAPSSQESQSGEAKSSSRDKRPFRLSVSALIIAAIALGLASVPALAFNQPLPNPFTQEADRKLPPKPEPEREGGVTLKFKSFSVNIGGKTTQPEPEEPIPVAPAELAITANPIRWFTISAIGLGLIGIVIALVGQACERHVTITAGSIGLCAAAITWQYFAVGIAIGAAVAACLLVLAVLGSILN